MFSSSESRVRFGSAGDQCKLPPFSGLDNSYVKSKPSTVGWPLMETSIFDPENGRKPLKINQRAVQRAKIMPWHRPYFHTSDDPREEALGEKMRCSEHFYFCGASGRLIDNFYMV